MMQVVSYYPFEEMTDRERALHELIRQKQEAYQREMQPYFDELTRIQLTKAPKFFVMPAEPQP